MEVPLSRVHESIDGVLDIVFVFDAFIGKEVVEMVENVIVGGPEVRCICWMRQCLVDLFVQL